MIHAGCGVCLANSHFLDVSGMELIDPLAADVSPAAVMSLLQSDIRMALKTALGESDLDGPLFVTDWCRGRVQLGEGGHIGQGYSGENHNVQLVVR